jgi:hypothetical protein
VKRALYTLLLLFTPAQAQTVVDGSTTEWTPAQIKSVFDYVGDKFRDPVSAQYRYLRTGIRTDKTVAICGEVNVRNGYGGYVGFQPFSMVVRANGTPDGDVTVMLPMDQSLGHQNLIRSVQKANGC